MGIITIADKSNPKKAEANVCPAKSILAEKASMLVNLSKPPGPMGPRRVEIKPIKLQPNFKINF